MRIHLIGMGGIGMSGIAQLFLARGEKVSGSDVADNPILQRIRGMGGQVLFNHCADHVRNAEMVVYSSSITPHNPELVAARNRNILVLHRGQAIARLVSGRRVVAVAGAHGKSTTTALAGQLLVSAGLDPTVVLGAEVEALGGNARKGAGPYAVVEADESDGSLLWLEPTVAVITNIDEEHLDYFRNPLEIQQTYAAFAARVRSGGALIGCADNPLVSKILAASGKRWITYGLSTGAEITAGNVELTAGASRYRCFRSGRSLGSVRLQVPGFHNVLNSLAIVALSQVLGIDFRVARAAFEDYRGAGRRFQIQGEVDGVTVVEDYGHHPTEIQATLQAARSWSGRRVRCVFQPHRYTRTRYLLSRFGGCFDTADELILLPIYAASEQPIDGVSSEALLRQVQRTGRIPAILCSAEEALKKLAVESGPGDLILFLGAGDVGVLARQLVEVLRSRAGEKAVQHAHA